MLAEFLPHISLNSNFAPTVINSISTHTHGSQKLCTGLPPRGVLWLSTTNPLRMAAIYIATSGIFNWLVILAILANCGTLAAQSLEPGFNQTKTGRALEVSNYLFTSIFIFEMVVKILAMGFIESPGSYMRDGWNLLDFAVITVSWLDWLPQIDTGTSATAARTARVLRPLRTLTALQVWLETALRAGYVSALCFPHSTNVPPFFLFCNQCPQGLRNIVKTLVDSLPLMFDVCVLLFFLFVLYGIIGVQLLSGLVRAAPYAALACLLLASDLHAGSFPSF